MDLDTISKKIEYNEKKLEMLKREKKLYEHLEKIEDRKARNHLLIKRGALLEISNLIDLEPELLLGYFLEFKNVSEDQKKILAQNGRLVLESRKEKKTKKVKKNISKEQIKELLELSKTKNIFETITVKFKKKLLEDLTIEEYENILKIYKR